MTGADWIIILLLLISAGIGLWRGFAREAISLASWLLGLWLAWTFADVVEPYLGGLLSQPAVKVWVARLLILTVVLLLGNLAGFILTHIVRHSPFGSADRALGLLFGILRGAVLIGIFMVLGHLFELDKESWWKDAKLVPYCEFLGDAVRALGDEVHDTVT